MSTNPYDELIVRNAGSEPREDNPYGDLVDQHSRRKLRGSALRAGQRNPDVYARADAIARRNGWPVDVVANDPEPFEQREHLSKLDAIVRDDPALAQFLGDPRRMALAQDDLDNLRELSRSVRPDGQMRAVSAGALPRSLSQLGGDMGLRFRQYAREGVLGLLELPVNVINFANARLNDAATDLASLFGQVPDSQVAMYRQPEFLREFREATERIAAQEYRQDASMKLRAQDSERPGTFTGALRYMAQNPSTLATDASGMAGAMVSGIVPGSRAATIALQSGQQASMAAAEVQRALVAQGYSQQDAIAASADAFGVTAAIGAAASLAVPGGAAFEGVISGQAANVTSGRVRQALTAVFGEAISEAAEESGVQAAQNVASNLPTAQGVGGAAAAGLVFGAGMGGVAAVSTRNPRIERDTVASVVRVFDSMNGADRLERLTELAAASKLGERSPDDLETLVEASGESEVYLAADAARVLFQSANVEPNEFAERLTGRPDAWSEAEATGGDLVIPAAKWASVVARMPNAREFHRNARFDPEALSAVELADYDIELLARDDAEQVDLAPETQARTEAAQRVEDDVLGQLQATGAYTPADAERQAKLYGAMFRTLATRLQTDAWSLYEPYALTVARSEGTAAQEPMGIVRRALGGLRGRRERTGAQELQQQPRGTERGRLLIFGDRTIRIELLKNADLSSFLHETGHFFWEVFADASQREGVPSAVLDDYRAVLDWMGAESADHVTTEHLEQWARGFERYLADGTAPSPELQTVFARFRAWLLDVYRDLRRLNVELSPEVRGVFDRLLATDEEIAAAQERQGMATLDLGAEPSAIGLTEAQWSRYAKGVQAARDQALTEAQSRILASQRQEASALRAEQRQAIHEQVEQEIADSPGVRAARILSGRDESPNVPPEVRGVKLDRQALVTEYGADWVAENLQPLGVLQDRRGLSPDSAATVLGFPTADAMVRAIVVDNNRDIEAETEARLEARHPLPSQDGEAAVTAMRAAHNDKRFEALDAELGLLAQLAKRAKPNRRVLRATAATIIARRPIRQIRPNEFLVAERRAARRATEAAARGRYAEALTAKRQQMLNAALYSEASLALETVDRHVGFIRRLEGPTGRKRMGRGGVLDAFEQLLEAYSFRPVSDKQRDRTATLLAWYDRMVAQGIEPQVPAAVMRQLEDGQRIHYREMNPAQLEEVVEVIRLLNHQAEAALKLWLAGQKHDLDTSADALARGVRGALKDRGAPPASEVLQRRFPERAKRVWRAAGAILLRLRTLANWVDGEGNVDGPFYRYVIRPLDRAQAAYLDSMREYGEKVSGLFDEYLKGRELTRPIWVASINQTLTKSDVLAVALNVGNASNLQRMQDGRGWGDVQMMEILGHMEEADWNFVQAVWDTLEGLWPQIAEQQQRLTGVEPPKVEPRVVNTPFGQYRGGYYPLVYDRDSSEWRAFTNADSDSFFDPIALTALPPHGHTKERVHRARLPVKLDLAVIPSHLSSILKDLSHRETVIGIRKLMKHHDVVSAMNDTMGPEYLDMVEDKLRQVATDQLVQTGRSFGPVRKFSRGVRRHVGIMAQGFSVSSGLKQIIGISNSQEVMLARHGRHATPLLLKGYGRMFQPGMVDAVMGLSGTMRHRVSTADADIRLNMNRYLAGQMTGGLKGKAANLYDGAIAHAYILIQYAQTYAVDLPLWLAAHEGALRKGLAGDAAIAAADDAVITAQGAGNVKDTALIEGQTPFLEWLTMFYSYGSAYLNRQVTMGRQLGKGVEGGLGSIAAELPLLSARALFLVAVPVILDDLVNQAVGAEDGPDDDEEWAEYYGKRAFAYLFYGIPGLRDIVGAKYGYRLSPAEAIPKAWSRLSRDMAKAMGGEEVAPRRVVRNAVNVVGYTLGLPLAGPWRHVDYVWRVIEGEEEPESVPEFAAAAIVAKREEH